MPGPWSSTVSVAPPLSRGRSPIRTRDPDGPVADRVVGQDRGQLAEPGPVAGQRHSHRIHVDLDGALRGDGTYPVEAFADHRLEIELLGRELLDPRVGAGQQEQVADERGQVVHLGSHVRERVGLVGQLQLRVALEVLDSGLDDAQRRAQLVAGVGRELALAAERLADRNEGAGRVHPSADDGRRDGDEAADDEDDEQRIERALLGADVLGDLHDKRAVGPMHGDAVDPDRDRLALDRHGHGTGAGPRDRRGSDHGAGSHVRLAGHRGGDPGLVRQPLEPRADDLPGVGDDQRHRARRLAPEDESGSGPAVRESLGRPGEVRDE